MNRFLAGGLALIVFILLAGGGWLFRPWADYSPFGIIWQRETGDRVELYRTMDTLMPHRVVAGAADAEDLPRAPVAITETYQWDGATKSIDQYAAESDTTALLVLKDGRVIFERYYNGETADSRHTSWSVAKSYVATLIGMALLDGTIASLDDRVEDYAPDWRGTDYGDTTLRQLLEMSSGIEFNEDYDARGSDIRKLFFNVFVLNQDVDRIVKGYTRSRPAGSDWDYISPNSHVLSAVLREAYGKPLAEVASEKIFRPLGMADATWLIDRNAPDGKEIGYCCLQTRAEDFARLGQLYLQDGVWNGERLLPAGWARLVHTPPTPAHMPGGTPAYGARGYGLHFWIPANADGEYTANGFNGQIIWIDPTQDVVVVRTAADENQFPRRPETETVMRLLARQGA